MVCCNLDGPFTTQSSDRCPGVTGDGDGAGHVARGSSFSEAGVYGAWGRQCCPIGPEGLSPLNLNPACVG